MLKKSWPMVLASLVFFLSGMLVSGLADDSQPSNKDAEPKSGTGSIWIIDLADTVNPGSAEYLRKGIAQANQEDATCIIIMLDTPGGLVDSMREMVQAIMASPAPVVVYVAPAGARAASAGAFLLLAGHVAAMAPATNVGAAHPVAGGGQEVSGAMADKITNDLVAMITSLAKAKGRPLEVVEGMVTESLSLDAVEAKEQGICDLIALDLPQLLKDLEGMVVETNDGPRLISGAGRTIVFHKPDSRHRLLSILANPNLAYILLMIGLAGLYFELSNPGAIFPGVIGGLSLILAFFAMSTLPVSYAGLALIILSLILFFFEIKMSTSGLLALAGAISLVLGSIMLFEDGPGLVSLSLAVMLPTLLLALLFFGAVAWLAGKAQRALPQTGGAELVGQTALVMTPDRVQVWGEIWRAKAAAPLSPGQKVKILNIEGLTLEVDATDDSN